jgi:hypothetical protein
VPEFTDARAELAKIDEQWAKAPRERRKALNNKAAVAVCPLFVNATCADHSGQSDRGQLAAEYLTLVREGEKARRRTDKVTDVLQSVTLVLMWRPSPAWGSWSPGSSGHGSSWSAESP